MVDSRDRIIKLTNYAKSLGISVNIGKNKARGNKGFFKTNDRFYRIDIAENLSEAEVLRVLVHELAHYVHYTYDKTLKSPDFIFAKRYSDFEEDLLSLTVDAVPKDMAKKLFDERSRVKTDIAEISGRIKKIYPKIKLNDKNNAIEKQISKTPYRYILKYDRVKVFSGFSFKVFSIDRIKTDFPNISQEHYEYLRLNSLKRRLKRINSKISRLNRYYNSPSELFARSVEYFVLQPEYMEQKTPKLFEYYTNELCKIDALAELVME